MLTDIVASTLTIFYIFSKSFYNQTECVNNLETERATRVGWQKSVKRNSSSTALIEINHQNLVHFSLLSYGRRQRFVFLQLGRRKQHVEKSIQERRKVLPFLLGGSMLPYCCTEKTRESKCWIDVSIKAGSECQCHIHAYMPLGKKLHT